MAASQKALHPRYAEKFQCIGSACEDTCCRSWQIPIDRVSFDKYHALPEGPLTPIFEANLVLRIQAASTPPHGTELTKDFAPSAEGKQAFYGQITLLPDGACPFLSAKNLCRIQTELGKNHLSHTCDTFPRATRTIDDHPEASLLLSCPEAARLVLLDRRFMHLPGTASDGHARYTPFLHLAASFDPPDGNPLQYLMAVRHLLILVLKDRSYPIWQRLFIIGLLCKRLTEVTIDRQNDALGRPTQDTVPTLLRSYGELMQQGRLRTAMDAMHAIPTNAESRLSIILQLLDARGAIGAIPERLLDCFQAFMLGIEFDARRSLSAISRTHQNADATAFQPFSARNPYLLENYLLNYIVCNRFPFGSGLDVAPAPTSPQQEFALMALRFSIINALAAGMAGHYREAFHVDHFVKLVQSFSKGFEHSLSIRETMLDLIARNNLTSGSGIATLLRV